MSLARLPTILHDTFPKTTPQAQLTDLLFGYWGFSNRFFDPIFALSIGFTAAAVRINREEKEKGRTTEQTLEALKRRTSRLVFGTTAAGGGAGAGAPVAT